MKLWIDDLRPAPTGYVWCRSVNEAKDRIKTQEAYVRLRLEHIHDVFDMGHADTADYLDSVMVGEYINLIDIDHDAGDFACDGGDYIRLLDWLEETHRNYPIRIHSMNPVGVANMRAIIQRNGWQEVR